MNDKRRNLGLLVYILFCSAVFMLTSVFQAVGTRNTPGAYCYDDLPHIDMNHKLNHTATVAVDQLRWYSKIDKNTPRGVKLILVTTERVAVFGVLTEANRRHFTHWEPLARIPDDEPLRIVIGGELKFVKQHEAEK